jgi:hypothetical protein
MAPLMDGLHVRALAARAGQAPAGCDLIEAHMPLVAVLPASKTLTRESEVPALDTEGFAVDEDIGQLVPGRVKNPVEGGAGDAHPLGALLLLKPLMVFEAYRLCLLHRESNVLQNA